MKHNIPPFLYELLTNWDNLGFNCKREAAEFILANKDWNNCILGISFLKKDISLVNKWRQDTHDNNNPHQKAK